MENTFLFLNKIDDFILQMVKHLTAHMKMHSKEKPHGCQLCHKVTKN